MRAFCARSTMKRRQLARPELHFAFSPAPGRAWGRTASLGAGPSDAVRTRGLAVRSEPSSSRETSRAALAIRFAAVMLAMNGLAFSAPGARTSDNVVSGDAAITFAAALGPTR